MPNPSSASLRRHWIGPGRGPALEQETVIAVFSVLVASLVNVPFWTRLAELRDPTAPGGVVLFMLTGVCVAALHGFLFGLLGTHRTLRVWLGTAWLAGVVIAFYMWRYTVYLDASMLRNILHSEPKEASELVTASMLATVLAACAPVWVLLGWIRLRPRRLLAGVWRRGLRSRQGRCCPRS
jgi:lipid A ethanolaminephosphotransferase